MKRRKSGFKGRTHTEETKNKLREIRLEYYRIHPHPRGMLGKVGWNKGLTKDDPRVAKYTEKLKGYKHTKESKTKQSDTRKRLFREGKIQHGMLGKHPVPWNKGFGDYIRGEKHPLYGKHHTDDARRRIRESRLQRVFPTKDTLPERILQQSLTSNNIDFKKHKPLLGICQCDVFIEPNIAIFVDGCWWHGCEQCLDRNNMPGWIKARKMADLMITQKLQNDGYVVLRFWEHEIHGDIDLCIGQINQHMPTSTDVFAH